MPEDQVMRGAGSGEKDNILLVVDGGQHYGTTQFKVSKMMKLGKLMTAFCQRFEITENTLKFLYDGQRITDESTPKDMGMEDGDYIEVQQGQDGKNSTTQFACGCSNKLELFNKIPVKLKICP